MRQVAAVVLGSLCLIAACGDGETVDPFDGPRTFGGDRLVELQLPDDLVAGQEYPLVLLLHGYGASGLVQTAYLGLGDVAVDPGAFFLAPEGTVDGSGRRFWNASDACCGEGGPEVDDVAYLGGLIDDVAAAWPVDPGQVFVIGHSNGAFMAYRLACDRADVITGIAGLAGSDDTGADCAPAHPVSVLHIHGTSDAVIAYTGGDLDNGGYPGAVASVTQWQHHDGCDADRSAGTALDLEGTLAGAETSVEIADGCPDRVGVELWTMNGASHLPDLTPAFAAGVLGWLAAHARP